VVEAALLGAQIERGDGIGTERSVRHGRDVEPRGTVGLQTVGPSYSYEIDKMRLGTNWGDYR
jgi:hypothetical protein